MRIQEARRKETNEQVDDDYMCEDAHKKKVNILGKKGAGGRRKGDNR